MTTLSASPGNAYGDDGMPGMNATTTKVQWFCDNTHICGLPAFVIGVAGILFFLISCIVWCYIYRTRLYLKNQYTTEEDNAEKVLPEVISDNLTLYDEATGYQIETTRRYQKDPTQDNAGKEYVEVISDNPAFYDEAAGYKIETKRRYEKDPTQKLCTQTKSCDEYDYVRATDVTNGDRKIIKEKLSTQTKSSDDYDYVETRDIINGNRSIIKEIRMVDTYSNENEMHIHSDLKKTRCFGNLKKYTSISNLGPLGNTPIASKDEKINNPSSVQGQKVNDTKTYPQLFPELTREFNQKYGKAKSEDVDCSEQYANVNTLSIEDPDNRMLVHGKELSEILEDVHSDRTRDFDDYERMDGPREILTSREDIQGKYYEGTSNPVYENLGNRDSSDSSNSDEFCTHVTTGVQVYKPRGIVQVTVKKKYYGQKMTNFTKATGVNRHFQ